MPNLTFDDIDSFENAFWVEGSLQLRVFLVRDSANCNLEN